MAHEYVKRTPRIRGVQPSVQNNARVLREKETPAEKVLWRALHGQKLEGIKFRRQHPVGRFVLDFYCSASHLVVELDGDSHKGREEEDTARTDRLKAYGYRVIRFRNEEVLSNLESVLERIRQEALAHNNRPPQKKRRHKAK